jgi:DNA-binding transcriptional LysR family regulator
MPLTRFTLRQLEAFDAVAETRGFGSAGNRMGLSSSALSQLVAELEATLGFRVFDRHTRRVELSSAGREFLGTVQTVLRHIHLAESAASDIRNRASGIVRLAAPMVLASSVLPNAISNFLIDRPKVVIRIRDTPVDSLVDRLLSGDVDLAVGPDRACTPNVTSTPAFNSPWVLWCAPSHPLARKKTLNWNELHGVSLVAAGRDHEQSVAQMHLNAPEGSRIRPVEVVDNITTALGLAAQGLAATLAPAYVGVVASTLGLVSRRVLDPETIRKVCVYKSTARAVNPAAEAFAEFLVDWLDKWNKHMRTAKPRPVVRSLK